LQRRGVLAEAGHPYPEAAWSVAGTEYN